MKIAIVGYGGMGKMIEAEAKKRNIAIQSIIDPISKGATHTAINSESLRGADVAIEFTHPSAVLANIDAYCRLKVNAVVGTTGWQENIKEVEKKVKDAGIAFLSATNFSVGVHAYLRLVESAAKLFDRLGEYDVWASELHHHNKADSPSGTAKTMSDIILRNVKRKKKAVYDRLNRKIEADEFHFSSLRGGEVNFEHTLGFDSAPDCITLRHAARNREGYAAGAIQAAVWLLSQKKGYYTQEQYVKSVLG